MKGLRSGRRGPYSKAGYFDETQGTLGGLGGSMRHRASIGQWVAFRPDRGPVLYGFSIVRFTEQRVVIENPNGATLTVTPRRLWATAPPPFARLQGSKLEPPRGPRGGQP